jgi:predicted component of type VI protein secretion system
MVQLQILSGNQTGAIFQTARFPMRAGRSPDADFSLDDPGVWARHFQIDWQADGLVLDVEPDALLNLNDAPVRHAILRNGDVFTLGAVRIRFSLSPVHASAMPVTEWSIWIGLAALSLGQVALIYALLL